ncbi:hypothetical protein CXQ81_03955 [Pseudomonas sp. 09C 129]|uniref:hypothetical protein n=1 Tax=Pseudomonas sp. 09C 129 TaxID=2054915 RepID=UPI000C6CC67D|nr:hypothetical protein [Pseudomonas sp. 09C 129]AUF99779.1 hypothetical protein CXQ81_03955 [Pseudomonas sp. 09C 129]
MNTPALNDLSMVLAFEDLADINSWPTARNEAGTGYVDPITQARWEGFELAHGPHGVQSAGQQLYAEIKKSSKYAHQASLAKSQGEYPFQVRVLNDHGGEYCVAGGPGSQYRLRDVNLYVISDGRKIRIN